MGRKYYQKKMENSMLPPRDLADIIVAKAVTQPTPEEQARAERLAMLENLRITTATKVEAERYALSVDGVGFFALDDIHALKSKQKAGKTTVLKVCTSALMAGELFRVKCELEAPTVMWLDTEQKPSDVKTIINDVCWLADKDARYIDEHLRLFQLRTLNYGTLVSDTRLLIEAYHPQVVLIDGIVEFVASFNDEQISRQLIKELMMMAEEFHCAMVCVLHENKSVDDQNMRGHLGTVLAQKAGTVLQCRKSSAGVITVSCPDSRHGQMPEWSIRYDNDGVIRDAEEQRLLEVESSRMAKCERQRSESARLDKERTELVLETIRQNGGAVERSELTKQLVEKLQRNRSTVANLISDMMGRVLMEDGRLVKIHPDYAFNP